jgi:hypothetical protein
MMGRVYTKEKIRGVVLKFREKTDSYKGRIKIEGDYYYYYYYE